MFESLGESYWTFIVFLAVCMWGVSRMSKKVDSEGQIKSAARTGVVALISRWLK